MRKRSVRPTPWTPLLLLLLTVVSCAGPSPSVQRAERLYLEGQTHVSKGDYGEAMKRFQESLTLSKEAGFRAGEAHNQNEMAILHTSRGEYSRARVLLHDAIETYKQLGMEPEVSKAMNNLAITYLKEGNIEEALHRYETLLAWDRKTGNALGEAVTLNNMGLVYERLGRFGDAREHYSRALEIFEVLGRKDYLESVAKNLARIPPPSDKQGTLSR
jgi:tetratricopeptide (TPR) repeat protein